MNDGSPTLPIAPDRDGCDCPPHILCCVHFDGDGIVLAEARRCGCGVPHASEFFNDHVTNYGVAHISDLRPCPKDGPLRHISNQAVWAGRFYVGDDLDAALAAFRKAEAELLGRAE